MTLKAYIWGMRLIGLFSLGALALVIYYVDPEKSGMIGKLLFYLILFFVLSSFLNLFLLFIRKITLGGEMAFSGLGLSFRQGILLAIFSIGLLILQSFRVLVWWDALLLLVGIFLIELYFLSRDNKH